jgi:hypothetical protein
MELVEESAKGLGEHVCQVRLVTTNQSILPLKYSSDNSSAFLHGTANAASFG